MRRQRGRRPLAERSLNYPSYTNFRDRRPGAGLLIQTNRNAAGALEAALSIQYENRMEELEESLNKQLEDQHKDHEEKLIN